MAHGHDQRTSQPISVWFWRTMLRLGCNWFTPAALTSLIRLANRGESSAAALLAGICQSETSGAYFPQFLSAITTLTHPKAISSIWQVWASSRSPSLLHALEKLAIPAETPDHLYVISRLALPEQLASLKKCSASHIPYLVEMCRDRDNQLASRARSALMHLSKPAAVSELCGLWVKSRDVLLAEIILSCSYIARKPPSVRVATCLLNNHLSPILSGNQELLDPLLIACHDQDPVLTERALQCLPVLQNQDVINGLCTIWSNSRDKILEQAIVQARYLPSDPPEVRLLIALKTGRLDLGRSCRSDLIPLLLSCLNDPDPEISTNARACALSLHEIGQEEICRRVVELDDVLAAQIALQAAYLPQSTEARLLFLFLTEQWDEYQGFDFDHSILRLAFSKAQPEMRARLVTKIRSSGKPQFLDILTGFDARKVNRPFLREEAETFIRILCENQQYDRLWESLVALPAIFAQQALNSLQQAGWYPPQDGDHQTFNTLLELNNPLYDLEMPLPIAVHRATLHVHGRVNEIAFSPTHPWIAIGTGQRKVVIWDYQTAATHRILYGFNHSIGQVAFSENGILLIGERSNATSTCCFYSWVNDQLQVIGSHAGSVTAIEPLDQNRVLTAGRDQLVRLWEFQPNQTLQEIRYYTWPRHLVASHNRKVVAFLTDTLLTYTLPALSFQNPQEYRRRPSADYTRSVTRCAAFSPDDRRLLVGQNNGQVCIYSLTDGIDHPPRTLLTQHSQSVQQVLFLPNRPLVATAGAEGQVRFFNWPSLELAGTIDHSSARLTALHVSPDGAFIATGTDDATMLLWDTRISKLPDWYLQPISNLTPSDLATISSLLQTTNIPPAPKQLLLWLQTILQHHYRYDIQLGEAVSIHPGDFDILLD